MLDNSFRRALYIRYADDFVVLMARSKELKTLITEYLKDKCGLDLNQEKTTIVNTRDSFKFLGAKIKRPTNDSIFNSYMKKSRVSSILGGTHKVTRRSTMRMQVDAPILSILDKLRANGFARRNAKGTLLAMGKRNMIHLTHFDIVRFFNSKITGLLSAYSFAGNYSSMNKVC